MATQNQRSRSQSTARALLASFLALLLCFATLLGTTYAWFTDSATTGTNTIKAGNLQLSAWGASMKNGSLDTSWTSLRKASDTSETTTDFTLFDDEALWEPGHTEVAYLKLQNTGSLALKYTVTAAFEDASGTNVNNEIYELSKYLYFGEANVGANDETTANATDDSSAKDTSLVALSEDGQNGSGEQDSKDATATPASDMKYFANSTDARNAIKDVQTTPLTSNSSEDKTLKAGETVYIALVIYMDESVNNDANAISPDKAASIKLGVTIDARQASGVESDSFGNTYDDTAQYPVHEVAVGDTDWYKEDAYETTSEYSISTSGQLQYLAQLVNKGVSFEEKTIKLSKDIALTTNQWTPIGTTSYPFKGTFDGQGHTISNLQSNDNRGAEPGGLFGAISNATISHVTVSGSITLGSLQIGGSSSEYYAIGGICGYADQSSTIERCTNEVNIDTTKRVAGDSRIYAAGILGYGINSTIKDCLNVGTITGISSEQSCISGITSIIAATSGETAATVKTCLNVGKIVYTDNESQASGLVRFVTYEGDNPISSSYTTECSYSYFCLSGDDPDFVTDGVIDATSMTSQDSYTNFDFNNIWIMGDKYPVLK
jgi:predicted ribosomally synthesized peptide with SipW-like signal peptide